MWYFMQRFTLIELLVIIAIIGISASLLFPSLSIAREKGIAAVCISNMKQSSIQATLYQSSNNGYHHMKSGGDGWFGWSGRLYEQNYFEKGDRSIFCPKTVVGNGSAELNEWRYKQNSYAGNSWGLYKGTPWGERTWLINNADNTYNNRNAIPVSSEFIFLGDSFSRFSWDNYAIYRNSSNYTNGDWGKIWTIHNPLKRSNAAFADGHVASKGIADWQELTEANIVFAYQ